MNKDNILSLLTPKGQVIYLDHDVTIRQALEKMRVHRYTAIPVVNHETGEYVGSVAEGDFLYNLIKKESVSIKELEDKQITEIIRPLFIPAMKVDTSMKELVDLIMIQNYVPIVDDRNILMGIITRKSAIKYLVNKLDNYKQD